MSSMKEYAGLNMISSADTGKARDKTFLSIIAFVLLLGSVLSSPLVADENEQHRSFPPYDLIKGNVKTTDITVAISIIDIRQEQVIRSDNGRPGYVVFRISARVFRCYKGNVRKEDAIVYHWCLEAGVKPPTEETKHIVSFHKKKGRLVIPDVAYHFEYSEGLHKLFEKAAKEIDDSGSV